VDAAQDAAPDVGYVLFTDADMEHPLAGLRQLVARSEAERLVLNSLLVRRGIERAGSCG
jgi:hypothetical protein